MKHSALICSITLEQVPVVLGPGINIKRNSLCGRNFEYFSEEPYLAGKLAAAYDQETQRRKLPIKDYMLKHTSLKVYALYIAQVKQKHGIIERECNNALKAEGGIFKLVTYPLQPCPRERNRDVYQQQIFIGRHYHFPSNSDTLLDKGLP